MKKFRLIVLLAFVFILSGCNIEYNVNIESDGKVEEKIIMTFNSNDVESNNPTLFINDTIKSYKNNNIYVNYDFDVNINGAKSTITAIRKYSSLEQYISNSEFLPSIFEKTLYIDDYGIKGLQTTGEYYHDSLFDTSVITVDEPKIDNVDIKVHSEFDLLENNADSFNKSDNTLYWNLNEENKIFSINFKYNNSKRYDIIIKDYLKKNWMSIVALIAIIVASIFIVSYTKKQNKINNKI